MRVMSLNIKFPTLEIRSSELKAYYLALLAGKNGLFSMVAEAFLAQVLLVCVAYLIPSTLPLMEIVSTLVGIYFAIGFWNYAARRVKKRESITLAILNNSKITKLVFTLLRNSPFRVVQISATLFLIGKLLHILGSFLIEISYVFQYVQ